MPTGRLDRLARHLPLLSRLTSRLDGMRDEVEAQRRQVSSDVQTAVAPRTQHAMRDLPGWETGWLLMPPPDLQDRVVGGSWPDFLQSGQESAENLCTMLGQRGLDLGSFDRILDFGCGCARTLRFLLPLGAKARPTGVDVDPDQIDHCRDRLSSFGEYMVISEEPPMPLPPADFDFIYSISTFTHFREDYQHHWLKELQRVSRPGAILILTIAGSRNLQYLDDGQKATLAREGIVHVAGAARSGHNPEYYHLTVHTQDYVRRVWSSYFDILDIVPETINRNQHAVLCRRR